MKKPTIAIDIDDVLAANAESFITFSNERWGTRLTVDDYHEHWPEVWQVDLVEAERRALEWHGSGAVAAYRHFEDAKEALIQLAGAYRLVVVTSRRAMLKCETHAWIDKHFPDIFDEIHFAGMWDKPGEDRHKVTKLEVCRAIGSDYLIDDQPKHCVAAANAGVPALLYGEYPWNRINELPKNVRRVKNWAEVVEYFDGQR